MSKSRSFLKRLGKIVLYLFLGILGLLLIAFIYINTGAGKNFVRNKVQGYLSGKLKVKVVIKDIDYSLPNWVSLKGVYVEDRKKDTLLFGEELRVDIRMLKLISGKTDIQKVFLKNIYAHISRPANDSLFNYQFIIDAFDSGKEDDTPKSKDTSSLKISLDKLVLVKTKLEFKDRYGGSDMFAGIDSLDVSIKKFQPDKLQFIIKDIAANGVDFSMQSYKGAGPDEKKVSTDDEPNTLSIQSGGINLSGINVLIDDKQSGLYYSNRINILSGKELLFDMPSQTGLAEEILLDSAAVVFSQPVTNDTSLQAGDVKEAKPWTFKVKQFNLHRSAIQYSDNNQPRAAGFDPAHIDAGNVNASLTSFQYSKDSTAVLLNRFSFNDKSGFIIDTAHVNFLMTGQRLSATDLFVKTPHSLIQRSFELRYDSLAGIQTNPQNSLVTAALDQSVVSFNDIYLLMPGLKKTLRPESFANQDVLFSTAMQGSLQTLNIPVLQFKGLSGSSFNARAVLYNLTDTNKFAYELFIFESNFLKQDLVKFIPPEQLASFQNIPSVFNLKGKISGDKNNARASISAGGNGIGFTGDIKLSNISDPEKLNYDLNIGKATVSRDIIVSFLPPETLQQIEFPKNVSASGKLSGNTENILTDIRIGSSYGPVSIKGYVKNIKDSMRANYDLAISTPGFAIGKLIKQDSVLGTVAGNFIAKGTGFDYKSMQSSFSANLDRLDFNHYTYRNADIKAALNRGILNSQGSINDSSIRLNYTIDGNVSGKYPVVNAAVNIDTLMLKNLHYSDSILNLSGLVKFNSGSLEPRKLDASLFLDSFSIQTANKYIPIDSLSLIATSGNGIDSISFRAPFADIRAGGAFDYDKLGASIQQYIARYYKLPGYQPVATQIPDQQFGITGVVYPHPVFNGLIPDLFIYEPVKLKGDFMSALSDSALNFVVDAPRLGYGKTIISNGVIRPNSANEEIGGSITFDTLNTGSNLFYNSFVNVSASHDSLSVSARTKDKARKDWFGLKGDVVINDSLYRFRLTDSVLLNYEKWRATADNYIEYSPKGFVINDFVLTSDTSTISIKSEAMVPNSPIALAIDNFNLRSIGALIDRDTAFISGTLDVKARLSELEKPLPAFTGTATVENLAFMEMPVGNITANAQKQDENTIAANLELRGNGNEADIKGNYYLNDTLREFNADLDLRQLNVKTIEAFSAGSLMNSSGNVHGTININGKFDDPKWKGVIYFDTTSITATQFGSPYKINNQAVIFDYPNIKLNEFIMKDSLGHVLKLDGNIELMKTKELALNVDLNCYDFILMNARRAVNNQFYGHASVDANISVTGTSTSPHIDGDIYVNDKSNFAIVLPEESYGESDGGTIVRFIDRDTFDLSKQIKGFEEAKIIKPGFAQYLFYNLNIEIGKASSLTIVIDPNTGDELNVQGDAQLNAGVDPGGNLVLSGTYELDKGYYVLNYQFLQRKFELKKGSTIVFSGPPQEADVNINAEYVVKTSAKDLLGNEVSNVGPELTRAFNQEFPFRVNLNLTGKLTKPDIKFEILLPEETNLISNELKSTIETKLSQMKIDPAATNKQVFSLLILGRFVSEQSSDFFKGNGTDFSSVARQSVSQFLSSALNEIAGDIFKGIDVDLNLNTYNDYITGAGQERTDVNVAISKTFLNDRLTVTVGKNFGVEGEDPAAKASRRTSGFRPDVSLAYKLTRDGKYMVRAYTKDQFEVVLDGYVVENGVSFIITMEYNKFKELFGKKDKRNP